ncbi:IclR family transcriptional regulator [Enterovirga rhinocerotis]|uniref:IclR family transcriptional regulator n=1 Tax=Enterovirga rhinocerotis TaxID=1339210 RepID=A0A4R7BY12_9HYPH|nr:IclR family transcriptional regulator [Enterovirga rhinocerotis]TDR90423.1 IclR family transcriptional regulator [Enterovirga rhinocerotis]
MHVRQAANVFDLMEFFERRRAPATLAEIADALGWPRSSTFNLVGTIVEKGYLYEPRPRAGYYPTPRWLSLAQALAESEPLPEAALALVREIAAQTGETTALATISGVHALFLEVVESPHSVRYHARTGDRVPIHASSVGRALLVQLPEAQRTAIYRRIAFERFSDTTPMSPGSIERELSAGTERGFHQSSSEYIPDLAGVSLPLPGSSRQLSVVVAGPTSRCLEIRPATAAIMIRARGRHFGTALGQTA